MPASAEVGTVDMQNDVFVFSGDDTVTAAADAVFLQTYDVSKCDTFTFSCEAGQFYVEGHDGNQWLSAPLSLADLGATVVDPVTSGVADRQYLHRGQYSRIRVKQNGVGNAPAKRGGRVIRPPVAPSRTEPGRLRRPLPSVARCAHRHRASPPLPPVSVRIARSAQPRIRVRDRATGRLA